jgi:hypothetical protein
MKCYYHHASDAVALCKSCNRALCPECSADVHPGTACKHRCEKDVADLNTVIERGKTVYAKTGSAYKRNAVSMLIIGLIFLGFGLLPIVVNNDYGASFMAVIGGIFLLWAFFSFKSARQINEVK